MHCRAVRLIVPALLMAVPCSAQQSGRPYTEGTVTDVQYIRVKPGRLDDYMAFLAGPYKQLMEGEKKAGVITDWAIFRSDNRDENDWNIALTTTYKNMAALDNLRDRTDPIDTQVYGSSAKSNGAMVKRSEMREIVGNRLLRQLIVK
jgi:hypothetical protein